MLKKILGMFLFLAVLAGTPIVAFSANEIKPKNTSFTLEVVETDPDSVADSLNRISGTIDTGFAPKSQVYHSENHYKPGPFAREQAATHSASS